MTVILYDGSFSGILILQDTVANLSQQSKTTDRSTSTCLCNQDGDFSQIPETTTINRLSTTVPFYYTIINSYKNIINL